MGAQLKDILEVIKKRGVLIEETVANAERFSVQRLYFKFPLTSNFVVVFPWRQL